MHVDYRPVGETIEYGEDSKAAVIREVKEEINQDTIEPTLQGIIDPWYGEVGYEFDFIYVSKSLYNNAYGKLVRKYILSNNF
ncbi:NUDIX domain-containing protein [Heyndrickxia oleronia]|uniref:NUDIX domain-containing protein n=1 Tax=Heyndrickxia oleronia TaxID=38875 RepID=UPI00203B467E|nr:NUDIX domain-containing protein [Heyndrickxia oleronia]MCM3238808.1 NUDIX domain-containing protein [Heyndrickxia oleronia]